MATFIPLTLSLHSPVPEALYGLEAVLVTGNGSSLQILWGSSILNITEDGTASRISAFDSDDAAMRGMHAGLNAVSSLGASLSAITLRPTPAGKQATFISAINSLPASRISTSKMKGPISYNFKKQGTPGMVYGHKPSTMGDDLLSQLAGGPPKPAGGPASGQGQAIPPPPNDPSVSNAPHRQTILKGMRSPERYLEDLTK